MKKFLHMVAFATTIGALCAIAAIAMIGVLCFYQTIGALPCAIVACASFFGAGAMLCHESDKREARRAAIHQANDKDAVAA